MLNLSQLAYSSMFPRVDEAVKQLHGEVSRQIKSETGKNISFPEVFVRERIELKFFDVLCAVSQHPDFIKSVDFSNRAMGEIQEKITDLIITFFNTHNYFVLNPKRKGLLVKSLKYLEQKSEHTLSHVRTFSDRVINGSDVTAKGFPKLAVIVNGLMFCVRRLKNIVYHCVRLKRNRIDAGLSLSTTYGISICETIDVERAMKWPVNGQHYLEKLEDYCTTVSMSCEDFLLCTLEKKYGCAFEQVLVALADELLANSGEPVFPYKEVFICEKKVFIFNSLTEKKRKENNKSNSNPVQACPDVICLSSDSDEVVSNQEKREDDVVFMGVVQSQQVNNSNSPLSNANESGNDDTLSLPDIIELVESLDVPSGDSSQNLSANNMGIVQNGQVNNSDSLLSNANVSGNDDTLSLPEILELVESLDVPSGDSSQNLSANNMGIVQNGQVNNSDSLLSNANVSGNDDTLSLPEILELVESLDVPSGDSNQNLSQTNEGANLLDVLMEEIQSTNILFDDDDDLEMFGISENLLKSLCEETSHDSRQLSGLGAAEKRIDKIINTENNPDSNNVVEMDCSNSGFSGSYQLDGQPLLPSASGNKVLVDDILSMDTSGFLPLMPQAVIDALLVENIHFNSLRRELNSYGL